MPTVIPVRMHFCNQDLWFDPQSSGAAKGDHVVVSTERGTEFGLATAAPFDAPAEEVKGELKPVLRVATDEDVEKAEELAERGDEAMGVFRELVKANELDMKPVGVEFLFGGEKVVFYFAAEDRVDFRDLVRELASHFHQRVDMRQIGVRDEARLVGGYAPCGQELCCVRFGSDFEPVSIRMAKEQDLPLNSSKISGVCGRLMCCLRYEFEAYRDFKQRAPKKNAVIETPLGKAKIVEYNTPRETLRLRLENGKSFVVALKDMTCSEGCRKRSAEQHIPLRPDTVTREALEQLGTADIVMQLAELDRANEPGGGYHLDDSLLEAERTPRRRSPRSGSGTPSTDGGQSARRPRDRGQAAQTDSDQARTPRRRSGRPQDDAVQQEGAQAPRRQRSKGARQQEGAEQVLPQGPQGRTRGGGMKPRRTKRQGPAPQEQAAQAQGSPAPRKAEANAPAAQPSRRTRRHHTAEGATAEATPQSNNGRERTRKPSSPEGGAGNGGEQAARRPRERSGNKGPSEQRPAAPQGGTRQRRQHHSAKPDGSATPPANPTEQRQPRRRRPGDHGGGSAGAQGVNE